MEIKTFELLPIPRQISSQNDNDEIYLSIEIGNGQIGGNKVTANNQLIAKGNLTEPRFIGKVMDIKDKDLDIETNVLDVNPFTNVCVITTTFKNHKNQILFTKIDKGDAPENGIASFKGKYLLRILAVLLLILNSFCTELYSQNNVDFQSLETPSSPGLILFDQTPSAIEKPTTPQGLGLSLLGIIRGGGALEFTPFWLTSHPDLTAAEMYNNKVPVLYNLSVSMATIQIDDTQFLSGGLRTRIFQTYTKRITSKLDSVRGAIEDALADMAIETIEKLRDEYIGIIENPSFTIDIAAAIGGSSTTNSFDKLELNRWASWISLNWRPKGNDFYLTTLARYINNKKFKDYPVNTDLM